MGAHAMRTLLQAAVVLAGILLSACSAEKLSETLFPEEVRKKLNLINDAIISRDHGALRRSMVTTSMSDEEFAAKLDEVFVYLPGSTFVNRELAEYSKFWLKTAGGTDRTTYSAGYQYEYTDGWAYVALQLTVENGNTVLHRLNITRLTQSLRELNGFTFAGKGAVHYVVFALAILIPIFIIATFVTCFRMRNLKRRKRWLAFILLGVGGVALNWTTGASAINILSVGILGAGFFMASALAPVMFKVWFPLGAVLFWSFHQTGKLAFTHEQSLEDNHSG